MDTPAANAAPDPLSMDAHNYAGACVAAGLPGGCPGALARYRALYRDGAAAQRHLRVELPRVARAHRSESGEGSVLKFVLPVEGRKDRPGETLETESVIIPMIGKKRVLSHTLCVSSQVGCAMGCGFCQTAQMGLLRSLTVREIVQQWMVARALAPGLVMPAQADRPAQTFSPAPSLWKGGQSTIRNLVFMGMGEPMDNLDAVIGAVGVLTDHNGAGLPMSKVTISTVGRADGIARLAEKIRDPGWHRLNLAVSLNAPNDEIRARIMPVNRRWPLAELRRAIEAWPIYGAAKVCFEYVLIPGVNDREEHARELGDYVLGRGEYAGRPPLPGLVNLIPYNPRDHSPWPAPDEPEVERFLGWLIDNRLHAKRRRTKGRDTMSACGQLGNPAMRSKPIVQVRIVAGV